MNKLQWAGISAFLFGILSLAVGGYLYNTYRDGLALALGLAFFFSGFCLMPILVVAGSR